ncbi:hypothetical protein D3C71_2090870 [compost metagenome]
MIGYPRNDDSHSNLANNGCYNTNLLLFKLKDCALLNMNFNISAYVITFRWLELALIYVKARALHRLE